MLPARKVAAHKQLTATERAALAAASKSSSQAPPPRRRCLPCFRGKQAGAADGEVEVVTSGSFRGTAEAGEAKEAQAPL